MKNVTLSIILAIIFISLPFSSAYTFNIDYYEYTKNRDRFKLNYPDNIYEWQDGTFSGTFIFNNQDEIGQINGIIKLGRTSDIGTFIGQWQLKDRYGYIKGFFINSILIGKITNEESKKLSYLFSKSSNF